MASPRDIQRRAVQTLLGAATPVGGRAAPVAWPFPIIPIEDERHRLDVIHCAVSNLSSTDGPPPLAVTTNGNSRHLPVNARDVPQG